MVNVFTWFVDFIKAQIGVIGFDPDSGDCQLPKWAQRKWSCQHQLGVLIATATTIVTVTIFGAVRIARKLSQRERIIYQAVDQQDPNENKALANEAVLYSGKKDFNSDMFGKLLEIDGILIHFAGQKTYRYELKLTWPILFISYL